MFRVSYFLSFSFSYSPGLARKSRNHNNNNRTLGRIHACPPGWKKERIKIAWPDGNRKEIITPGLLSLEECALKIAASAKAIKLIAEVFHRSPSWWWRRWRRQRTLVLLAYTPRSSDSYSLVIQSKDGEKMGMKTTEFLSLFVLLWHRHLEDKVFLGSTIMTITARRKNQRAHHLSPCYNKKKRYEKWTRCKTFPPANLADKFPLAAAAHSQQGWEKTRNWSRRWATQKNRSLAWFISSANHRL